MKITFIFSCSGMFRDVPECSGVFHVPAIIDALSNLGRSGARKNGARERRGSEVNRFLSKFLTDHTAAALAAR